MANYKEYNQDQIEFIPRLAAIYDINNQHIFKFLYGKAINRASWKQNIDIFLDPEQRKLKVEHIQTIEFNYIATFASKLTSIFSVFRNSLDNLLSREFYRPICELPR